MRNIYIILILIFSFTIFSCAKKDESSSTTSTTELEGAWVSSCYSKWDTYWIKTWTFTGSALVVKWDEYSDSSCATDYAIWTDTYSSFSIGNEATLDNGSTGRKFTMTVDTNTYTPLSASNVTWSNDNSFCGESDWVLNTPQSIAGKTCGGGTWWNLNIAIYGMYILDGTKLMPNFQSSTSGSYPSSVSSSTSNIFIKQ